MSILIIILLTSKYASLVSLKTFQILLLNPLPSNWNCLGVKVICSWQLHWLLGHLSCNFRRFPSLFKSHHAPLTSLNNGFFGICFFFKIGTSGHLLGKNLSFVSSTKTTIPLITLTILFVLGFTFSYRFWFIGITIMLTTNAKTLSYLIIRNLFQEEHSVQYPYEFPL